MASMFQNAAAFNGDLSRWNTGSVKSMARMFAGATDFTGTHQRSNLSRWNLRLVQSMESMFQHASAFTGVGCSLWDVGRCETMKRAFMGAKNFDANLSLWMCLWFEI